MLSILSPIKKSIKMSIAFWLFVAFGASYMAVGLVSAYLAIDRHTMITQGHEHDFVPLFLFGFGLVFCLSILLEGLFNGMEFLWHWFRKKRAARKSLALALMFSLAISPLIGSVASAQTPPPPPDTAGTDTGRLR